MKAITKDTSKGRGTSLGVIGIDEVGRGPLAGPITVCAFYIEDQKAVINDLFHGNIRDSKRIQKSLRNNIYETIRKNRYTNTTIKYTIYSRSSAYIDRYGISKAASVCVQACLKKLKACGVQIEETEINLDAGLKAPTYYLQQKSFIKGDERFVEIALASIMAKEWRDSYMRKLAKHHPQYLWEQNMGYGTKAHRKAIDLHGSTEFHRMTFLKAFKLLDKPE